MIVVDTSVVIKWIREDEVYRPQALKLYNQHISQDQPIIVPSLLFIEVANVLVTKTSVMKKNIIAGLNFIKDTKLNIYSFTPIDLVTTAKLARDYKTSGYDMLFAVVAKTYKITLITADAGFIARTRFTFVKHIKDI